MIEKMHYYWKKREQWLNEIYDCDREGKPADIESLSISAFKSMQAEDHHFMIGVVGRHVTFEEESIEFTLPKSERQIKRNKRLLQSFQRFVKRLIRLIHISQKVGSELDINCLDINLYMKEEVAEEVDNYSEFFLRTQEFPLDAFFDKKQLQKCKLLVSNYLKDQEKLYQQAKNLIVLRGHTSL